MDFKATKNSYVYQRILDAKSELRPSARPNSPSYGGSNVSRQSSSPARDSSAVPKFTVTVRKQSPNSKVMDWFNTNSKMQEHSKRPLETRVVNSGLLCLQTRLKMQHANNVTVSFNGPSERTELDERTRTAASEADEAGKLNFKVNEPLLDYMGRNYYAIRCGDDALPPAGATAAAGGRRVASQSLLGGTLLARLQPDAPGSAKRRAGSAALRTTMSYAAYVNRSRRPYSVPVGGVGGQRRPLGAVRSDVLLGMRSTSCQHKCLPPRKLGAHGVLCVNKPLQPRLVKTPPTRSPRNADLDYPSYQNYPRRRPPAAATQRPLVAASAEPHLQHDIEVDELLQSLNDLTNERVDNEIQRQLAYGAKPAALYRSRSTGSLHERAELPKRQAVIFSLKSNLRWLQENGVVSGTERPDCGGLLGRLVDEHRPTTRRGLVPKLPPKRRPPPVATVQPPPAPPVASVRVDDLINDIVIATQRRRQTRRNPQVASFCKPVPIA